ncbi:MAG: NAD-dependent epimerase/dehydratase family protein [Desulfobacteraceae bacterium]|nr:NAD-dependent epimerase/dehydratase family protein [Desulfobacteraceae bacterium]
MSTILALANDVSYEAIFVEQLKNFFIFVFEEWDYNREKMKTILVTGASGFVGRAVCRKLSSNNRVIGFDKDRYPGVEGERMIFVSGSITDKNDVQAVFGRYTPDSVVHCAGIAHQKFNTNLSVDNYDQVNNVATKNIALAAIRVNPSVHFIFLSSICVYGEKHGETEIKENDGCWPTSQYAVSKLTAENNLVQLFDNCQINKLDILRLAPVYDISWSGNLEKRVCGPQNLVYLRFGSGDQKMSILARQNLVDFISHRIENNLMQRVCNYFNVTDKRPCSFNKIIKIFKTSEYRPDRRIITVSLSLVWIITRVAGLFIKGKGLLIYSFYDKLSKELVFDNTRMLETGFDPRYTLKSVFARHKIKTI